MGEKRGNCFYIDADHKWWIAEIKNVLGTEDVILIEEKTDELTACFKESLVEFVNAIAPHILYTDQDENWCGVDAKYRKAIYPK